MGKENFDISELETNMEVLEDESIETTLEESLNETKKQLDDREAKLVERENRLQYEKDCEVFKKDINEDSFEDFKNGICDLIDFSTKERYEATFNNVLKAHKFIVKHSRKPKSIGYKGPKYSDNDNDKGLYRDEFKPPKVY